MSIRKQFKFIIDYFNKEQLDFAIVGAFALYAYGYTRATRDIDIITRLEYQEKIITYFESQDFKTLQKSEGFSNHLYPAGSIRIDFIYIDDNTAEEIFKAVKKMNIFDNIKLPVISPEHLIALKLFAITNDPERKFKDLADIKELVKITNVNRDKVKHYFKKYQLEKYYNEIVEKYKEK